MTPTGHADFGVQNLYLKTNQGPKVLESSLARGPLQCQSEHYNSNTRCAVATDCTLVQQFCVVALSTVATRDAPLQQMGNSVGCVVARTCEVLLQHAMRHTPLRQSGNWCGSVVARTC